MIAQLLAMTSGECRWIGRHDLHVYCVAPCELVRTAFGRDGWQRKPPAFKLWTEGSAGSVWDEGGWTTAANVARQIENILAKEVAA
jgi:hypothetical protein